MSSFSPNKGYVIANTGEFVDTWATNVTNPDFTEIDLNLGGVTNIGLSNVNVVLGTGLASQASGLVIRLSGTLSASVSVTFPAVGSFYYVDNLCTGPFYVQLIAGAGQTIGIPQGTRSAIFTDGSNVKLADDGRDWPSALKFLTSSSVPNWFAGYTVQPWLNCNGQAVSRITYSNLFSAVSTTFGSGDGTTTFNVPDLRGRVPLALDAGANRVVPSFAGFDGNVLGTAGGNQAIILDITQIPVHNHGVDDPEHIHPAPASGQFVYVGGSSTATLTFAGGTINFAPNTSAAATGISIQNAGGGLSHINMQPSLVSGIWLIKT